MIVFEQVHFNRIFNNRSFQRWNMLPFFKNKFYTSMFTITLCFILNATHDSFTNVLPLIK